MEQTAISVLQEYLQKNKLSLPIYEMINRNGPHHESIFTTRVTCGSYAAVGSGNTKKSSKHNAASAMIKLLNTEYNHRIDYKEPSTDGLPAPSIQQQQTKLPCDISELPKKSNNSPKTPTSLNSVGKLQEVCVKYNMKTPVYEECGISEKENSFTICCTIGTFVEKGTASSKKQAKQNCAELMRQRLIKQNYIRDDIPVNNSENHLPDIDIIRLKTNELKLNHSTTNISVTKKAKELFPDLKKNSGITIADRDDLAITNFHCIFRNSFESSTVDKFHAYYKTLRFDTTGHTIENLKNILQHIITILNIQVTKSVLKTNVQEKYAICYEFNTVPLFREIGTGNSYNEAHMNLLKRTIAIIYLLLS